MVYLAHRFAIHSGVASSRRTSRPTVLGDRETMKKAALVLVLALLLPSSLPALADGMFYWPEPVPPGVPYQRALLLFDGKYETLIVQSQYRLPVASEEEFGWVVPVPSVPDLASMDPQVADRLFLGLSYRTQPEVTDISDLVLVVVFFVLTISAVVVLVACILSFFFSSMHFVKRHRRKLATGAGVILLSMLAYCFLGVVFFLGTSTRQGEEMAGVDVIKAEQVGIYDVQVVKAEQAVDLIQWLSQNRFQFDEADTQVFDQYLRQGWGFVVAKIDPGRATDERKIVSEGLVAPLIMRFQVEAPVYPLALTATSGHETQVLLYVLSEHKWQEGGRLELHYAGMTGKGIFDEVGRWEEGAGSGVEPRGFFSGEERALPYLCKFKGTLTSEQMREDLTLMLAEDDDFYRKHIIIW